MTDISSKNPVKVATTVNITLSAPQTIDGVSVVALDRVLVKNQTNPVQNGIWLVQSGAWTRAADFDGAGEVVGGTEVFVTEGATQASTSWFVTGSGAILPGTNAIAVASKVYAEARTHGVIAPETFGAVGDGVTNDAVALQAFFNALGPNYSGELGQRTYRFDTALTRTANEIAIRGKGAGSVLLYGGANTTNDLITIGTVGSSTIHLNLQDFKIDSNTTMTAGAALRCNWIARSRLEGITYSGQDGTGKIFDGLFLNGMDYVYLTDIDMHGQGTGIKACAFSAALPGAGLFIDGGKIGGMGLGGMLFGGGIGGVYLDNLDIINCGLAATAYGLKIDNSLVALQNREFQLFNVSIDGNTGYGVHLNDSLIGTGWFIANGTWNCSNSSYGYYVQNFGTATIQLNGGTVYNNVGTGLVNFAANNRTFIEGTDFRLNRGGGILAANNTHVNTLSLNSNTGFDVDGGALWYMGIARDNTRYSTWTAGYGSNPVEAYDANDYTVYDRVNNRFEFYIGGVRRAYIDSTGVH